MLAGLGALGVEIALKGVALALEGLGLAGGFLALLLDLLVEVGGLLPQALRFA